MPSLVYIASPLRGLTGTDEERALNVGYAKRCLRDSLFRGEAPFASHLLYPQVLNDHSAKERALGHAAALDVIAYCDRLAVYTDRGISEGMIRELEMAWDMTKQIEYRQFHDYEHTMVDPPWEKAVERVWDEYKKLAEKRKLG